MVTFDLSTVSTTGFYTLLSIAQAFDPQHTSEVQIQTLLGLAASTGVDLNRSEVESVKGRELLTDGSQHELHIGFWKLECGHKHVRTFVLSYDNMKLSGEIAE